MNSDEFWRQCVEWLVETGVLSAHHKTRFSHSTVFDLAQTLRDGVLLCNLLNTLQPGVIDESQINLRAQMSEFLCMQNIRVVVNALGSWFGIPRTELFSPQDLYQMTRFGQVLHALSYLSTLPICSSRYKPFQQSRYPQQRRNLDEEEDIYRNLPDLAAERDLADEDDNLYDSVPEEKEEGIYGCLIDIKTPRASVSAPGDKRSCCIHEIVETENNYVQHLDMMVNQFMNPLRQMMDEKDISIIFMNIEQLRPIHTSFRNELQRLQQEGTVAKMCDPFLEYRSKFLVYGDYCSNMMDAQDHLEACVKGNESLRIKVEDCQMQSSRNKFKLRELLCVPMQRILKYHLLIKELNKHTPENHPDKPSMPKALTAMQELSQYINEVKRDSEELIKINQIESTLDEYDAGIPLRTYGRVRKDGELKVKFDDKGPSARNVFLFDKALFMTKLKNDTYILKDLLRLEDMKLDHNPSVKSSKPAWSLTSTRQGVKNYIFFAKTSTEKDKWLEAFKDSFDNISPRALKGKKHNFEMHTFSDPTTCSSCDLLLKGIFYQGYQCSVTNARCHKSCLAETMKLIENNSIGGSKLGDGSKERPPPIPIRGTKKRDIMNSPTQKPAEFTAKPLNYKAHRDYNGTPAPPYPNANFITFTVGQPIEVFDQITPDWWKGKCLGSMDKIGFFPSSFVSPADTNFYHEKTMSSYSNNDSQSQRAPRPQNYLQTNPLPMKPMPSVQPGPGPMPTGPIEEAPWYAGVIDRLVAEKYLWDKPTGTFLIRKKEPNGLVISLKFNRDVKHIKILKTDDNMHYVSECKNFRSVQELIRFYQSNSLSGVFLGLETTLRFPYRDPGMFPPAQSPTTPLPAVHLPPAGRPPATPPHPSHPNGWPSDTTITVDGRTYDIIGQARALYDFEPRSPQELALQAGQFVNIISKAGGAHGWWKGEYGGEVGYFPTAFVEQAS